MQLSQSDIQITERTAIQLFFDGIKADATRNDYTNKLKKVLCEYLGQILKGDPKKIENQKKYPDKPKKGVKRQFFDADWQERANELVKLAIDEPKTVEAILMSLVQKLKQRNQLEKTNLDYITSSHINHSLKPIKKLFDMNNIPFSWSRINSIFPEDETYIDYEEYSLDDIKRLVDYANVLSKVLVLLWSSSGIRAGAFDFKWKHLHPVYLYKDKLYFEEGEITEEVRNSGQIVCGFIEIYADSKRWNYYAFVTPECYHAIDVYKEKWTKKFGVEPQPNDPFFANTRSKTIQPLTLMAIRRKLERLLVESGLRTHLPTGMKRYKTPAFNGFRYFFNKQNKKAYSEKGVLASLILKESMMGHTGLIQLDKNYFREHAHELIEEYLKAVPTLTISDEERVKLKVLELRRENHEKDQKYSFLEARIKELEGNQVKTKSKATELNQVETTIEELEQRLSKLKLLSLS
jgi:hypothetical protein